MHLLFQLCCNKHIHSLSLTVYKYHFLMPHTMLNICANINNEYYVCILYINNDYDIMYNDYYAYMYSIVLNYFAMASIHLVS